MSDQPATPEITEYDLLTVNMIDSLISRVEVLLARDLSTSAHKLVQDALVRLAQDQSINVLLKAASTAATVALFDFDVDIREAPAEQ